MIGKILILSTLAIVVAILLIGIAVSAFGGEASGRWSNVLMRYRIVAQGAALVVLALAVYFAGFH